MGILFRGRLSAAVVAALLIAMFGQANAKQKEMEEVVVTGSYIKGTPKDAELPVDVVRQADLENQGNPTIIEMVRNLSISSGNLGETNQFQTNGGQGNEGVATINLRGLGAARTLVLLNGRRQVATETVGVDISAMPQFAIGRIEMLKDGAAALYGSDAIGGVVNFITRDDLDGFQIGGDFKHIKGGNAKDINVAWGKHTDKWNTLIALQHSQRDEIPFKTRDWAVRPYSQNNQGGWSAISNPANILFFNPGPVVVSDPRCQDLGAWRDSLNSCGFQFTYFDNLQELTKTDKVFGQLNYDLSDNATLNVELLYAHVRLPTWKTSPSYPPQSLFNPDRYVMADHPGLVAMRATYPSLPQTGIAIPINRGIGVVGYFGQPQTGIRDTKTRRLALGLKGTLSGDIDYDVSMSYSDRKRYLNGSDMFIQNMGFALRGFGGPNCDRTAAVAAYGASPGTYDPTLYNCMYYNPFSNAIEKSVVNGFVNPDYNPAVANDPELIKWLFTRTESTATNSLLVFQAVFSGETGIQLKGGNVGWAAGVQSRRERYKLELGDIANRAKNPCPWTDPLAVTLGFTASLTCDPQTGLLAFLAASDEEQTNRTVYGVFTEFSVPVTDKLNLQLAARYEDYGGLVGSTIDPKLAFSFKFAEGWTLRGSASSTFRGPPQSYLGGTATALQFNSAVNAFKAVDIVGNPNLKPEKAITTNLGIIYQNDRFYGSIDYWAYDFKDPLQTESAGQVVAAYLNNQCYDTGAGVGTVECDALRQHIFPTGADQSSLQRTVVNIINGSTIKTSGLDVALSYDVAEIGGGLLTLGSQMTYTFEYKSEDFVDINGALLAPGGDFAGQLNDGNSPFQSLPDFKANFTAKWVKNANRFNLIAHYTTSYKDTDPTIVPTSLANIKSQTIWDFVYATTLFDNLTLTAAVLNIADSDPPQTATDLNYDPYTANPYGRMFKIGLKYDFQP